MLFVTILPLCGCTSSQQAKPRILWPPPPKKPLIEYVGNYYSQDDFPKKKNIWDQISRRLLGAPEITFRRPYGIVSFKNNDIYLTDPLLKTILHLDYANYRVRDINLQKILLNPKGMAVDERGLLYVADAGHKKVFVFNSAGVLIAKIGNDKLFNRPVHVAVHNRLRRLYVSDSRNHHIFVFSLDGEFLFSLGGSGNKNGLFAMPHGMAFSKDDKLYVADMLNARIQIFDPDGRFVSSITNQELEYPRDIAFSSDGMLHIIDIKRAVYLICDPTTGAVKLLTGGNQSTSNKLGFSSPATITITDKDTVLIADQINKRFSIWQYLSDDYLRDHPITEQDIDSTNEVIIKKYWNKKIWNKGG